MQSMEDFWTYETQLTEGSGYGQYSLAHLLCQIVFFSLQYVFCHHFDQKTEAQKQKMIRRAAIACACMEGTRDVYLVSIGVFRIKHLPFHLCGQAIFIYLIREFCCGKKGKAFLGEIAVTLNLPGAIAAVLFPDWTEYPLFSFMNLMNYATHFTFVLYPLLIYRHKEVHLAFRHMWYEAVYLAAVCIPLYYFNVHFGTNFMFLNEPVPPLDQITAVFGPQGYIPGLCLLMLVWLIAVYGAERKLRTWRKN